MFENGYPYTDLHELNLDWLIRKMKDLEVAMETFKATESLKFADPIIWDISKQYEKSTVVLDPSGNAYLSLQPVPVGIQLNNDDYWLEIFNFTDYTRTANQNLTVNVETNTTRATAAYAVDDWLIWNDILYRVTAAIAIDDAFIVAPDDGANIIHFTVEDFIKAFITYATGLINQYKNDIDASELAYRQQLAQDIANTTASLQAQLNTAIAGATVDSEVINARVGYDSTVYPTLGDAVRTQISDLHTLVSKCLSLDSDDAVSLQTGDNLNDFNVAGTFKCTAAVATTLQNAPNIDVTFRLIVINTTAHNRTWQIVLGNSSQPPLAIRSQYNTAGNWSDWLILSDKSDITQIQADLNTLKDILIQNIYHFLNSYDGKSIIAFVDDDFTTTVSTLGSQTIMLSSTSYPIKPYTKFYVSFKYSGNLYTTERFRLYLIGYDISNNIVQRLQFTEDHDCYFTAANVDHMEIYAAFTPNGLTNVPYDMTFHATVILMKYKVMLDKKAIKVVNQTPISAIRNQLPSYFIDDGTQLYVDDKCDFINNRYTGDRTAVTFITDVHWKNNQRHSPDLIGYINNKCNVDLTVMGGDILNNATDASSTSENIYQLNQFLKPLQANVPDNMLFVLGNHDNGLANGSSLSPAEQAARIVNFENLYKTCVFPWSDIYQFEDSGNYTSLSELWYWERMHYFYDDLKNHIRHIVINTGGPENPATVSTVSYGRYEIYYQLQWLYDTLIDTPDGYSVIVWGHYFFGNNKGTVTAPAQNIARMLVALKTHTIAYTNSEAQSYGVPASFNFTSAPNIDVIGTICGHSHYDCAVVYKGTDSQATVTIADSVTASDEILMMCTGNDSATVRDSDIPATIGTVTEQLFDVYLITKQAGRVYTVRFGAGDNRSFVYRA